MKVKKCICIRSVVLSIVTLYTLFSSQNTSLAQATSSPYSRYGIGDIGSKGFGQNSAMGGTSIALQNDSTAMFFINSGNPASYSGIRLTTVELGVNANHTQIQSSNVKQTINSASLAYLSIGIPLKKWWGASVGLIPYSTVGYKVSDHQDIANVGPVDFLYQGNGGINQFYLGNGIKPLYGLPELYLHSRRYDRLRESHKYAKSSRILKRKKALQALSLGFNTSYMFGNISNIRRAEFQNNGSLFNTRSGTTARIGDIYLDYGIQYAYTIDSIRGRDLKDNVKLLFGATFANQTSINAKVDSLSYTYIYPYPYEYIKDTIQNVQGVKGTIQFPMSFGFGFGIKKGEKLLIAADFRVQNWSTYKAFSKTQGLKDSKFISIGAQYVPNAKANGRGSYIKRINYRIGARYVETPIELKNTQLSEYAITFGAGFPVGRSFLLQSFSMVNLGVEIGQRGTTDNGLIKEQFVRGKIGFTINDRWFVKPKFD
jgi:hypothetical protein